MKNNEFLSAGEAARALGVSVKTIQRWEKAGLLPVVRTATNQRRLPIATVHHLLKEQARSLRCAIYARLSSAKQEHEGKLARQEERVADLLSIVSVFSGSLSASRAKHIRSCVSNARKRLFESSS